MSRSQRNRNDWAKIERRKERRRDRHQSGAFLASKTGKREVQPPQQQEGGPTADDPSQFGSDSDVVM